MEVEVETGGQSGPSFESSLVCVCNERIPDGGEGESQNVLGGRWWPQYWNIDTTLCGMRGTLARPLSDCLGPIQLLKKRLVEKPQKKHRLFR